jgi:hypothetical protein
MEPTSSIPPELPVPDEQPDGYDQVRRVAILAAGGLIAAIVLVFILGVILAITDNDTVATIVQVVRDIVIILLALEGILVVLALAILILQIARLISLLQVEVKPVLENAQETVKSARGTVEFVSDNVAEPVIQVSGFAAGVIVVLRDLFGIRRAIRHQPKDIDLEETESNDG